MFHQLAQRSIGLLLMLLVGVVAAGTAVAIALNLTGFAPAQPAVTPDRPEAAAVGANGQASTQPEFEPRTYVDSSGFIQLSSFMPVWQPDASPREIAEIWKSIDDNAITKLRESLIAEAGNKERELTVLQQLALFQNRAGRAEQALETVERARTLCESDPQLARQFLYTVIYLQGITSLRLGENENCIMCRGESSCTLPISEQARHTKPRGSRMAAAFFGEYLARFPDDLEVKWLRTIALMTLGEYPGQTDPRGLVSIDRLTSAEFDIGRFRDIGHLVGVNRLNQGGGAIMDDFDNDGLLDLVVSSFDPTERMGYYRNTGKGDFEERSSAAGFDDQFGGIYCCQADYDNDGDLDLFVSRGAWIPLAMRQSLLQNDGRGTFRDVTIEAGLAAPATSNSASWADYDNDGWLDLFVCNEQQPSKLYHNKGDGTFEDVTSRAKLPGESEPWCKGAAWFDYDNDGYPDLFMSRLKSAGDLYHNNRDGTFTQSTAEQGMGLGPFFGFPCWAWDYDNDGWLDLFATSYDLTIASAVRGITDGTPAEWPSRLYRNNQGKSFEEVGRGAGLDAAYATMGSNFGDLDNDGFLDVFLGTGQPNLATLLPNRLFKNVAGGRFSEISVPAGVANIQKGHGVSFGDWDRDGDLDLFMSMGGAVNGDKYHNILYQNPGQTNRQITVKLVGVKTNRSAFGARIKMVTAPTDQGPPLTVHRHISTGSSFGANPLEQSLGLGQSDRAATLEIYWPTSGTTQVFRDIPAGRSIEITEFATEYKTLTPTPILVRE